MAYLLPLTDTSSIAASKAPPLRWTRSCGSSSARCRSPPSSCDAGGLVKDGAMKKVIRVSDPLREGGLPALLSVPLLAGASPSSPPSPSLKPPQQRDVDDDDDEKQRYYVNMGYAIRSLREDFPDSFQREPNFDIYREDVVFKDPFNSFLGIDNYRRIFQALRLSGHIFFRAVWINIASIWQPAENVIMIRWIAHGIPRVPWESHGRFDGTSEYKLDKNGKIYEHRVDNIALNTPTKFQVLPVEELIQLLGCPSTPKATYFESSLLKGISSLPFLLRFSWVRYYFAIYLVLAFRLAGKD